MVNRQIKTYLGPGNAKSATNKQQQNRKKKQKNKK
jgi:hypothetical protein